MTPDATATPTRLGIADVIKGADGRVVDKQRSQFTTQKPIVVLSSTAAAVEDDFSVPGQKFPTQGGGDQYMINDVEFDEAIGQP